MSAAVAALSLLAVVGCGRAARHEAAPTVTTFQPGTIRSWLTVDSGRAEVQATVRAYWQAYLAITRGTFDAGTAQATASQVATGPAVAALIDVAGNDAIADLSVRGAITSHPRVVGLSESSASVIDCVDDRTGAYRADGTRVDVDDPRPHRVALTLVRATGGWRVTAVDQLEASCVPGD